MDERTLTWYLLDRSHEALVTKVLHKNCVNAFSVVDGIRRRLGGPSLKSNGDYRQRDKAPQQGCVTRGD